MNMFRMADLDLRGKRVLIREDFNVPVKNGAVTSLARITASLPTVRLARESGAKVILLSHLGRPAEGLPTMEESLAPVAKELSRLLGSPVPLVADYLEGVSLADGEVILCENVRFNKGEKKNDEILARKYAALCDIYVMDAFATAHRAEASTCGAGYFAPTACAGLLLGAELDALERALAKTEHPFVAIIGGSKVSTKLTVLDALLPKVDRLIVGGGIANNFIRAAGHNLGLSLFEPDLVGEAARLMAAARKTGGDIPIPVDVVVGPSLSPGSPAAVKPVGQVGDEDMILDIGPQTASLYADILAGAATIVWNGPVGAFETDQFGKGTEAVCAAVAGSPAFSIAGGGDTLAALEKYRFYDEISYCSTAGGAFLEFLEGKTLPAVAMLQERARKG
ncbi:MAG: phosphoglycerate kinase [Desulfovibrio sp.]|jgi:phosphoglycerate kinase|nr:phosphoglycerate kinase [Desulfovibrio sp.]